MRAHVMKSARFDTLKYSKRAKEVGFTEQQAEFQAESLEALAEILDKELATKKDLSEVKNELKSDLLEVKNELKSDLKDLEMRMCSFFFRITASAVAILVGLQTLFHFLK